MNRKPFFVTTPRNSHVDVSTTLKAYKACDKACIPILGLSVLNAVACGLLVDNGCILALSAKSQPRPKVKGHASIDTPALATQVVDGKLSAGDLSTFIIYALYVGANVGALAGVISNLIQVAP